MLAQGAEVQTAPGTHTFRLYVGAEAPGKIQLADRAYVFQGDLATMPNHVSEGVFGRADARPGEDLARKFIRFIRDGRFEDQGLVTIAGWDVTGGNLHFERPGGTGTYRFEDFTLFLKYSDGYERGLPVLIRPEDQDHSMPAGFSINTYPM
jgi:hypothetical protein